MATYTEVELRTFDLSSTEPNFSLSVTSLALISDLPHSRYSSEELNQLIQSKQLWLISPELEETEPGFLEYIAGAICQCPIWPSLGLTIKQEDIQYQPLYDGAPNLYFIIEHLHKSSVLLSPPHSPTARLDGIECLFRYQSASSETSSHVVGPSGTYDTGVDDYQPEMISQLETPELAYDTDGDAIYHYYCENPMVDVLAGHSRKQWDDAAHFAHMALCIIIGIKKRIRGLRLLQLDDRPSLLELAPAIWNAHYLKAVTFHAASIPIISSILAACPRARSSSLREKSKHLLVDDTLSNNLPTGTDTDVDSSAYRHSAQEKLWDLVRTKLEPTVRIRNTGVEIRSPKRESVNEVMDFIPPEIVTLVDFERGDYVDVLEDIGFHDALAEDWQSYQYPGSQAQENDSNSDIEAEYRSWPYDNQDMPLEMAEAGEEEHVYPAYIHAWSAPPIEGLSNSDELYSTSTIEHDTPDYYNGHIMDIDELHTSDYSYNVPNIYDTTDRPPYSPEYIPQDESRYESIRGGDDTSKGVDEGLIDNNYYSGRGEADTQDVGAYG